MMDSFNSFLTDPQNTQEEILQATYQALCEHGYSNLTIQHIGDHFEKSVSLLYHHYNSKDEVLLDFLSYMLSELEESIVFDTDENPKKQLEDILNSILTSEIPQKFQNLEYELVEVRAQAVHNEDYREQFKKHDEFLQKHIAEIIQRGIEQGKFREVNPSDSAVFLCSLIEGVRSIRSTSKIDTTTVQTEVDRYLRSTLYLD